MVELLFFGQLTDITGTSLMNWDEVLDTEILIEQVKIKYPQLSDVKFIVAVNNKVVTSSIRLTPGSKVAFMPPFSGG